jgi:hypothetical protein
MIIDPMEIQDLVIDLSPLVKLTANVENGQINRTGKF